MLATGGLSWLLFFWFLWNEVYKNIFGKILELGFLTVQSVQTVQTVQSILENT
jgi:hypothetical protein